MVTVGDINGPDSLKIDRNCVQDCENYTELQKPGNADVYFELQTKSSKLGREDHVLAADHEEYTYVNAVPHAITNDLTMQNCVDSPAASKQNEYQNINVENVAGRAVVLARVQ